MHSCRQAAIGRGNESGLRHRGDTNFPASNLLGRKVQQRMAGCCVRVTGCLSCRQAAIGRENESGLRHRGDTSFTASNLLGRKVQQRMAGFCDRMPYCLHAAMRASSHWAGENESSLIYPGDTSF
jgi:hypothetical protein